MITTGPTPQIERCTDAAAFLRLLHKPGDVFEIRAPNCPTAKGGTFTATASGYFGDADAAAKEARRLDAFGAPGIYATINPVEPALMARAANRIEPKAKATTNDGQIIARRWKLLDLDPVRPAGISATAAEMELALALARTIRGELLQAGWPAPLYGMSGNGAYLLYRVELPNDEATTDLLKRVLEGLAERYDTDAVKLDRSTFNASRICKLFGTTARKGDNLRAIAGVEDRPHRLAWFERPDEPLDVVPAGLLAAVAKPATPKPTASVAGSNGHYAGANGKAVERCRKYIEKLPDAINGQHGSDRTLQAACECYRFGLSDADAREILESFNATKTAGEPWGEKELAHKLDAARKKVEGAGEFGMRLKSNGKGSGKAKRTPKPTADAPPDPHGLPVIDADEKDLATITPQAVAALAASNNPPTLFRHGGLPARIEAGDTGEPVIKPLDFHRTRHELSRRARWQIIIARGDNEEAKFIAPPKDLVNDVLASPDIGLPILNRIVEAPVFAHNGELQTTPGYHAASGVFYAPAAGFSVPDVSAQPTAGEIAEARGLLVDELLGDFPFVGESEIAHAIALAILPYARDLIGGPTPLHLFEKPTPGTGATLLIDTLCFPATGRPIGAMTEGRDEDEWRKRITARLRSGAPFVLMDNLRRRLDSAAVSSALTATWWEDRLLGSTEMLRLPNRAIWLATGNNPSLSNEITRRTIRIRLDPKQDRPWLRSGFRIADLRGFVAENRGRLVRASLTLIRAWLAAGRPAGGRTLGMFEQWAKTIGGILDVAAIPGFLGNLETFYEESDGESAGWRAFLAAWFDEHGSAEILVKDVYSLAVESGIGLGDGKEQSQKVLLGKLLVERRDRIFDVQFEDGPRRLRIAKGGTFRRAAKWRIEESQCESVSLCESPCRGAHARAHAGGRGNEDGNTHTHSHTHTEDPELDAEPEYDPFA